MELAQITEAVPDRPAVDTRYGRMFYFPNDDPIGKALAIYGEWAQAEIKLLSAFVGLGSNVIDVGANIGTHTLAFSRRVGPSGLVRAFEPQGAVFNLLERTLALNNCTNVKALCAGAGRAPGEMLVPAIDYASHANLGGVALLPASEGKGRKAGERTPIIALDNLALEACHLIKIDAEGMEEEVLTGAAETIHRLRPVVYLECNTVDTGAAILRAVDWSGFRFFVARTAAYNPANHRGSAKNFFGVARESSILCLPEEACGLLPADRELVDLIPVGDLQQLAEHLLATPRYGDTTSIDRNPACLREELLAAATHAREAAEVQREEVGRLRFRCANLAGQLTEAERALAERSAQADRALAQADRALAEQAARADGTSAALHQAHLVLNAREGELAMFRASTFWRATAPLRGAVSALRGLPVSLRGRP